MVRKTLLIGAIALATVAVAGSRDARDWGATFSVFSKNCQELGGTLHGSMFRATCSFDGGLRAVPARAAGWTVTVAEGSVATWFGAGHVKETVSAGTVVVACHDQDGKAVPLWQQERCALP